VHEEGDDALQDEGKEQNGDDLGSVVADEVDEVAVPTGAEFLEGFGLRFRGINEER
jgi:hypothetical protein